MSDEENRASEEAPREAPKKETSGEYLWRVLKPAGCIAVLALFVAYLIFCFTYRSDPKDAPQPAAAAVEETAAQE